jgi:hypothetical protein
MFCNQYGPMFEICKFNSNEQEKGECSGVEAQLASTVLRNVTVFSSANSSTDPEPPSPNWVFKLHRKFT